MTEVIDRLAAAVNAHDLDAVAGLIHQDHRSEQLPFAEVCSEHRAVDARSLPPRPSLLRRYGRLRCARTGRSVRPLIRA